MVMAPAALIANTPSSLPVVNAMVVAGPLVMETVMTAAPADASSATEPVWPLAIVISRLVTVTV